MMSRSINWGWSFYSGAGFQPAVGPEGQKRGSRMLGAGIAIVVAITALTGCRSSEPIGTIELANAAYNQGDYENAFRIGRSIAERPSLDSDEGAYLAGLAAGELGDTKQAVKYLKQAAEGYDPQLAADAGLMLGLAYSGLERYADAADALLEAAPVLTGEERAKAYYYAAIAQQRLGRWAPARDALILAKASSNDPDFRQQIEDQLAVDGYTLQVGSFGSAAEAQDEAERLRPVAEAADVAPPSVWADPTMPGRLVVHVGHFSTYRSAGTYRDRMGLPEAFIVTVTPQTRQ